MYKVCAVLICSLDDAEYSLILLFLSLLFSFFENNAINSLQSFNIEEDK